MLTTALATVAVAGHLQLWQRTCTAAACSLPVAIGTPVAFEGEVTRPAPGVLSTFTVYTSSGPYTARVTVYWAAGEGEDRHYLSAQTRVERDGAPIAECSRFDLDDVAFYYPVGACSGLDPAAGAGFMIGATVAK